jgi:5-methyltetrahydropteroyltriglutamate--homocysteine methyltransferase
VNGQPSAGRILTTHVGSLPRPAGLLDLMRAKMVGDCPAATYEQSVERAVFDCVRRQAETGIDILTDGEQSKAGFFTYVRERLDGFEARPHEPLNLFPWKWPPSPSTTPSTSNRR